MVCGSQGDSCTQCLSLTAAAIVLVFIFAMYLLEATLVCKCWTFSVEVQENNFTQIKKKTIQEKL